MKEITTVSLQPFPKFNVIFFLKIGGLVICRTGIWLTTGPLNPICNLYPRIQKESNCNDLQQGGSAQIFNVHGCDPFNQNSDRCDREKWSTPKGGPVFSKLFWLERTDPLSFGSNRLLVLDLNFRKFWL